MKNKIPPWVEIKEGETVTLDDLKKADWEVPEYYQPDFKGRPVKRCPDCNSKMEYDGWGHEIDTQKIDEFWMCKKCDKMFKNP